MYGLVTHGDTLFGVANHAAAEGPSVHYTLVFNVFVLMQVWERFRVLCPCPCCLPSSPRSARPTGK